MLLWKGSPGMDLLHPGQQLGMLSHSLLTQPSPLLWDSVNLGFLAFLFPQQLPGAGLGEERIPQICRELQEDVAPAGLCLGRGLNLPSTSEKREFRSSWDEGM